MTSSASEAALHQFVLEARIKSKGVIFIALVVGDIARTEQLTWPLDSEDFTTGEGNGQVRGAGASAVRRILGRHDIPAKASGEGGRTSRGTVGFMRRYVAKLNECFFLLQSNTDFTTDGLLEIAERFWIERIREKLAEKPFAFALDSSRGIRFAVRQLIGLARERADDSGGQHIHGTVLQHLVGAKLSLVIGERAALLGFNNNKSNTKDDGIGRSADFNIADTAVHVTVSPSLGMMDKCVENLRAGLRPVIITTREGVIPAENLADAKDIGDRVDILDIEQFVASNIYERSLFQSAERKPELAALIERYNDIVLSVEEDQSLTIVVS